LEEGDGWLTKEIPGWVNSVIVNANEGTVQTQDISIETGKDIWVVVTDAENYEVSYEEPTTSTAAVETKAADATEEADTAADVTETEESNHTVLVVVIVLVVLIAAVVIVMAVKKNKK